MLLMKKLLLTLAVLLGMTAAEAEIRMPALISDHMVLQRETKARIWGWCGEQSLINVKASWNNETYKTRANKEGFWMLEVETGAASFTPGSLEISEYKYTKYMGGNPGIRYENDNQLFDRVEIKDILIGEVWLAGGQSNMEMPLKGFPGASVQNGTYDATHAFRQSPGVRMMMVQTEQKSEEQEDCHGEWTDAHFPNPMNWSATAYYYAASLTQSLQVPVGIVCIAYGGSTVESWCDYKTLNKFDEVELDLEKIWKMEPAYERPLLMYNAMFPPIKNYTYKGIIFYQGCSNVGVGLASTEYAERLATMVKLWREKINLGDIPFHYVEIAPYDYEGKQDERAPYLREQQYKAQYLIPNSFMISTNDLVEDFELHNIHPRQKHKVGERLCWVALNRIYGLPQVCCAGPRYKDITVSGDTCLIGFTDLQMGICRNYDIQGFEVAGEDRKFYPAQNALLRWQTNQVLVRSDSVPNPVAVRYCFHDFQVGTLVGGNELPAFPFRTDDW